MGLNSMQGNLSSGMSGKLPSGLSDSVQRASNLSQQMQAMSCPQFNPGMPGAAKAAEFSQHLTTLGNAANNLQNPMSTELNQTQSALNKVRAAPTPENIQNYQTKAAALQQKSQQIYGSGQAEQQKAANFASNAQANASTEQGVAQQRAFGALQQDATHYRQLADNKSGGMLSSVDTSSVEGFKSSTQQIMFSAAQNQVPNKLQNMSEAQVAQQLSSDTASQLQSQYPNNQAFITKTQNAINTSGAAKDYVITAQKAQSAMNAATNMQNKLSSAQQNATNALLNNPYSNLNNSVQSLSLPNCPQLSGLQNQLSGVQNAWSGVMAVGSLPAVQQLQAIQQVISALPESLQEQLGDDVDKAADSAGVESEADAETPEPGLLVVNGAVAKCVWSTSPIMVEALSSGVDAAQPIVQPLTVKFMCEGLCNSLKNPNTAALTAAAQGALTPGACLAAAPGTIVPALWAPTTEGTQMINGQPCLIAESIGTCIYGSGADISFIDPGQTETFAKQGI